MTLTRRDTFRVRTWACPDLPGDIFELPTLFASVQGGIRRNLVRGVNAPLPPEAKKILKI